MSDGMIELTTPLTEKTVRGLHAGDRVRLSGIVYTGRDAAHARLVELLEKGGELPFPPEGAVIYYVGPAPAKPPRPIGSAGPTTSYRMDSYTPPLLKVGVRGMVGKGLRGENVVEAMKKYGAVYFAAIGGAAALISKSIVSAEVIAYEDLGTEAIRRLEVRDFPLVVAQDSHGRSAYEDGKREYRTLESA